MHKIFVLLASAWLLNGCSKSEDDAAPGVACDFPAGTGAPFHYCEEFSGKADPAHSGCVAPAELVKSCSRDDVSGTCEAKLGDNTYTAYFYGDVPASAVASVCPSGTVTLGEGGAGGSDSATVTLDPKTPPATKKGCQLTVSGSLTADGPCNIGWLQIESGFDPKPYIGGTDATGTVGFDLFDLSPKVGTFKSGTGLLAQGLVYEMLEETKRHEWRLYENQKSAPDSGSYTVKSPASRRSPTVAA